MRHDATLAQEMLVSVERVLGITAGLSLEAFLDANDARELCYWHLLVLGEAAKGISDEGRTLSPDIRWRRIAGLRDMLAHQYWRIDPLTIFALIRLDLPPLRESLAELLKQLPEEPA